MSNLIYRSASDLRRMIAQREISPVELMQACLDQISTHNPTINAICTVSEQAMDEARRAEQAVMNGEPLGLLHGLPVGLKDMTDTADLRTTYGSTLYANHLPAEDSLVAHRIKQSGGIVIGKTNTPEFALGANTYNDLFGATRNPWNTALSAGGSTGGGGAALASGMITLSDGSDLGGSLRIPASFNGIVGLRPSPGLVPSTPSEYLWDTLSVNGPMARTVPDVALLLQAIAGPSPRVPLSQPINGRNFVKAVENGRVDGLRIAYAPDIAGIGVDAEVKQLCREAAFRLEERGAKVTVIDLDLSFAWRAFLDLRGYEVVVHHLHNIPRLGELSPNVVGNIQSGRQLSMDRLAHAERTRTELWQKMYELFQQFDHLLTPCVAIPPFPVEQNYPDTIGERKLKTYVDWIAPTFLLSLTSLPVACVPCGLTQSRLPIGMQVVGPSLAKRRPSASDTNCISSTQLADRRFRNEK